MKKIILIILATVYVSLNVFSQSAKSTDIYFIVNPTVTSKKDNYHQNVKLYLNHYLVSSFNTETVVKCKLFSKGRITISIVGKSSVWEGYIDIIDNETYYYLGGESFKVAKKEYKKNETISKESFDLYLEEASVDISNILEMKEDINNPIGNIPTESITKASSQGTGFLVNSEGYVITNFHVIEGAEEIKILGIKGDYSTSFVAKVIAIDRQCDLALLKVESKLITFDNPPYSVISSKNTKQAEKTFTLGYPIKDIMGIEIKITDGIINSLSGYKGSVSEFQISAGVQPGNSGSPLFNNNGEIIGVVSAKIQSEGIDNVGYAIKSDYLNVFLNQIEGVHFSSSENTLYEKELTEQVKMISNFIYLVITE